MLFSLNPSWECLGPLTLHPPHTPKKVFGFAKISWVPFLKVDGFEPTQTHP